MTFQACRFTSRIWFSKTEVEIKNLLSERKDTVVLGPQHGENGPGCATGVLELNLWPSLSPTSESAGKEWDLPNLQKPWPHFQVGGTRIAQPFPNWLRDHQWGTDSHKFPPRQGRVRECLKSQDPFQKPHCLSLSHFKRHPISRSSPERCSFPVLPTSTWLIRK